VTLDQLRQAMRTAPVVAVQNAYNVADRSSDEVLEVCALEGIAFLAYFPLGAGWRVLPPGTAVKTIADRRGASVVQVALAWLLQRSPVLLPIPGTSSVAHLEENVGAASIHLSDEELVELEAARGE
jgi:pyridoxine 4-dehydrogenase